MPPTQPSKARSFGRHSWQGWTSHVLLVPVYIAMLLGRVTTVAAAGLNLPPDDGLFVTFNDDLPNVDDRLTPQDYISNDGFTVPDEAIPLPADTARPKTLKTYVVDATAYTSSVEECDGDPFITADGSRTHDGVIAANFLPFGTKLRLPTVYGDKTFEVHDRMNSRYRYRVDVWLEKKVDMRQFGIKRRVPVEVIAWGNGQTRWSKPLARK